MTKALHDGPSRDAVPAWPAAGLALFLCCQAALLFYFLRRDARPPPWDQAIHLEIAVDYHRAIGQGRWDRVLFLPPKPGMPPFPPLYHLTVAPLYGFFPPMRAARAAIALNGLYLALLCVCLLALARKFRSDSTALAAPILFCCTTAVQSLLHTQLIDLAMTAWAAAAYWALLESDGFRRWKGSIAFGALFAIGMLHKWSFFSYMFPALWMGLNALRSPAGRSKALWAACIAAGLCLPWYAVHLPLLPARLVQASSDFAVPIWRQGAFSQYFLIMAEDLGLPFCLLAGVGLLIPSGHKDGTHRFLLPAWIAASFLFWVLVPNRQMRFLLPGLPALAVLACAHWPRPIVWTVTAFQALVALNYSAAFLPAASIRWRGNPIALLPRDPPSSRDWGIAGILEEAQRRHDPAYPLANLSLVANDTYFNGPNFTWMAKALSLPTLRLRGINRRLCEFSEFVVLKEGTLGPPTVTEGLPEAKAIMLDPRGWFSRAYGELSRRPLPDGSAAVLFGQSKPVAPPFPPGRLRLKRYEVKDFLAKDLGLEFNGWTRPISAYKTIRAGAAEAELRGLRVNGLRLVLEDALAHPVQKPSAREPWRGGDVRFMKMRRLRVESLTVSAESLKTFLERRAPGLGVDRVEVDGLLRLQARWKGVRLRLGVSAVLEDGPRRLSLRLEEAALGPLPLPARLLGRAGVYAVSLEPNPETPFWIDIPGLTLKDGRLSIP